MDPAPPPTWLTAGAATLLVLVHVHGGKLRLLDVVPRSGWLSFAGGLSIAYVFLHLLPELGAAQQQIDDRPGFLPWLGHHAYLVALLGLVAWYGMERALRCGIRGDRGATGSAHPDAGEGPAGDSRAPAGVFWLHIFSFAVYNGLVGYLLVHREQSGSRALLVFALAMALHFLVNDVALRRDHRDAYHRLGRWLLALAVAAGWGLGIAVDVGVQATALLFALLAGGVILNVLKEELPEERASRFWPFLLGCAGYAGLLYAGG